jgi:hypothetical protein
MLEADIAFLRYQISALIDVRPMEVWKPSNLKFEGFRVSGAEHQAAAFVCRSDSSSS